MYKEASYTKITYKKIEKLAWMWTENSYGEILTIIAYLFLWKKKINTGKNLP